MCRCVSGFPGMLHRGAEVQTPSVGLLFVSNVEGFISSDSSSF